MSSASAAGSRAKQRGHAPAACAPSSTTSRSFPKYCPPGQAGRPIRSVPKLKQLAVERQAQRVGEMKVARAGACFDQHLVLLNQFVQRELDAFRRELRPSRVFICPFWRGGRGRRYVRQVQKRGNGQRDLVRVGGGGLRVDSG